MKYIRTKDGRIIDTAEEKVSLGYHPKEANTIEELCDEFVFVYKRKHYKCQINEDHWGRKSIVFKKRVYHKTGIGISSLEIITKKSSTAVRDGSVYGAIWTEWGLKYAAKMNEKGKLELL